MIGLTYCLCAWANLALIAAKVFHEPSNYHNITVVNHCEAPTTLHVLKHGVYGAGTHAFRSTDSLHIAGNAQPSSDSTGESSISVVFNIKSPPELSRVLTLSTARIKKDPHFRFDVSVQLFPARPFL